MDRIKKVRIRGFKRLYDINLELKPLMVLIGANGVGKTSFLDALTFLFESTSGTLYSSISLRGGLNNILTKDANIGLQFGVETSVSSMKYQLDISRSGVIHEVTREVLSFGNRHLIDSRPGMIRYLDEATNELIGPKKKFEELGTSLAQANEGSDRIVEFRDLLKNAMLFRPFDIDPSWKSPILYPQQLLPVNLPGWRGETLFPFLLNLQQSDRDRYEMITDSLRVAFPGFVELNFPTMAAGMVAMTWKEKGFATPIYMNQLSEGTLRFLWLVSLLASPGLPAITMIDEPEVSLHPELLSLLADLMREASERTQLIVATHSDRLIRFLKPNEVVVMDLDENGHATATWADTLNLDEWLKDYGLDEVWRMGRMGGRA